MTARRRLSVSAAGLAITAALACSDHVSDCEKRVYHSVNDLPDQMLPPVWTVMQLGALGTVPAVAAIAAATNRRPLALRLLVEGCTAWVMAKAVKSVIRRPRPSALLASSRQRGRDAGGLGYLSGHAGVAAALAAAALPALPRRARPATLLIPASVGLARLYVGAHLPLDVLGGAFLGLAIDSAITIAADRTPPTTQGAT